MIGPDIAEGVPTADGMESWGSTTVPMVTASVEGMPQELATYIGLGSALVARLDRGQNVVICVEPGWDGCDGRWLNIDIERRSMTASICAVALLDPERMRAEGALHAALPLLATEGWDLVEHSSPTDRWGFWRRALSDDPLQAAREALTPALVLFGVYEPQRWFVTMDVNDEQHSRVDLRRWRARRGLEAPPPTLAPAATEPWAILCDAGHHHLHAPPCWDQDAPWPDS